MSDSQLEYVVDEHEYDARQRGLVVDLVLAIEKALSAAGLAEEQVTQLTGDIAFGVCSVVDASGEMVFAYDDLDDDSELPLIPSLSFFVDEERTKLLVSPDGSSMHEYVYDEVDFNGDE